MPAQVTAKMSGILYKHTGVCRHKQHEINDGTLNAERDECSARACK